MTTQVSIDAGIPTAQSAREKVAEVLSPLHASIVSMLHTCEQSKVINSGIAEFASPSPGGATISLKAGTKNLCITTAQGGTLELSKPDYRTAKIVFRDQHAAEGQKHFEITVSSWEDGAGCEVNFGPGKSFGLTPDGFTYRITPSQELISGMEVAVAEVVKLLDEGKALAGNLRYADVESNSDEYANQVAKRAALSLVDGIEYGVDCYATDDSASACNSCHRSNFEVKVEKFSIERVNGEPFGWVQFRQVQAGDAQTFNQSARFAVIRNGEVSILDEKVVNCGSVFGADKGAFSYIAETSSGNERRVVTIDGSGSTFLNWKSLLRGNGVTFGLASVNSDTLFVAGKETFPQLGGSTYHDPAHIVPTSLNREDPASSIILSAVRSSGFDRIPFVFGKWIDTLSKKVGDTEQTFTITDTLKLAAAVGGSWSGVVTVVNAEDRNRPRTVPVLEGSPLLDYRGLDIVGVENPATFEYKNGKITANLILYNSTLNTHQLITLKDGVASEPQAYEPGVKPGESRADLVKRLKSLEEEVAQLKAAAAGPKNGVLPLDSLKLAVRSMNG